MELRALGFIGAVMLLSILNSSLIIIAYVEEKVSMIGSWSFVTVGSTMRVNVALTLCATTGSTNLLGSVRYTAEVKDPPWIVKVYAAIMQYYDYGYGGHNRWY